MIDTKCYLYPAVAFKEFGGDMFTGVAFWPSVSVAVHTADPYIIKVLSLHCMLSIVSRLPHLHDSKSPPSIVLSPSLSPSTSHSISLDPTFFWLKVKSGIAIARLLHIPSVRWIIVLYGKRQLKLSWISLHTGIDRGMEAKLKSPVSSWSHERSLLWPLVQWYTTCQAT